MTYSIAQSLVWAAICALPLMILALVAGRLSLPPRLKVWACRLAFLKLPVGLLPVGLAVRQIGSQTQSGTNSDLDLLVTFLVCLWATGVCVVAYDLIRGYRASRELIGSAALVDSPEIARLSSVAGIRTPEVRQGREEGLPFAAGIFKPMIVIPVRECEPSVLAHEVAHIRSRDMLWNLVCRIILGIFWFVPFIHKLEAEQSLWQEASADQDACRLTNCPLKSHANSIVQSMARPTLGLVWDARLSGNGQLVSRRLQALYGSSGSRAIIFGAILFIAGSFAPWKLESVPTGGYARVLVNRNAYSPVAAPIATPVNR